MSGQVPAIIAVGLLGDEGPWVGFVRQADGYRLAYGAGEGATLVSPTEGDARRAELLAVAAAYFEEAIDPPPPELEATQGDLAALVRWIGAGEPEPARRRQLQAAIDAIDDGLAGDVVASLLVAPRAGGTTNEQADAVDLLDGWYQALSAPSD